MLSEAMNNGKDPFFAVQSVIKLLHKFMIDMKHLRNSKELALIGINADVLFLFIYLNVEQRQGVYHHIACQSVCEIVGIGEVVILYFVLRKNLAILFLVFLCAVGASLKKLQNLSCLDLVNFMPWVRGMYCRFWR